MSMSVSPISYGGVATPVSENNNSAVRQAASAGAFEAELNKQEQAAAESQEVSLDPDVMEDLNERVMKIRDAHLENPMADTSGDMLAMLDQAKKIML